MEKPNFQQYKRRARLRLRTHLPESKKSSQAKRPHIATLSIRGTNKQGVREEVENWMTENNISIVALQETKSPQSKRETRKNYTWCFSGNGENRCNHGVGIVIRSDLAKHIEDIEPINERLMYITPASTLPISIIVTYMPTSTENAEIKDKAYENQQNTHEKIKKTRSNIHYRRLQCKTSISREQHRRRRSNWEICNV
jgi:exonuclease III